LPTFQLNASVFIWAKVENSMRSSTFIAVHYIILVNTVTLMKTTAFRTLFSVNAGAN